MGRRHRQGDKQQRHDHKTHNVGPLERVEHNEVEPRVHCKPHEDVNTRPEEREHEVAVVVDADPRLHPLAVVVGAEDVAFRAPRECCAGRAVLVACELFLLLVHDDGVHEVIPAGGCVRAVVEREVAGASNNDHVVADEDAEGDDKEGGAEQPTTEFGCGECEKVVQGEGGDDERDQVDEDRANELDDPMIPDPEVADWEVGELHRAAALVLPL